MRELECKFEGRGEVKGYLFEQISFENNWYIYKVSRDNTIHYEVFKRREAKAAPPFSLVDQVVYPKANSFGIWAWTASDLSHAQEIIKKKTFE